MAIDAISEFGRLDPEIASLIDAAELALISSIRHRIEEGKVKGEISAGVDPPSCGGIRDRHLTDIRYSCRRRGNAKDQQFRSCPRRLRRRRRLEGCL